MESGQRVQADTSNRGDLLPLLWLKCSKGRSEGRDALVRRKEEITSEGVCQMLQERKKESHLPAILNQIIPAQEEHLCQLSPKIQVHKAGVLASCKGLWKLMEGTSELKCGKPKKPRLSSRAAPQWVWEEETRLLLPPPLPGDSDTVPKGDRTTRRAGSTVPLPPMNTGWERHQGGRGSGGEGVKHFHVQMRNLELAFPK